MVAGAQGGDGPGRGVGGRGAEPQHQHHRAQGGSQSWWQRVTKGSQGRCSWRRDGGGSLQGVVGAIHRGAEDALSTRQGMATPGHSYLFRQVSVGTTHCQLIMGRAWQALGKGRYVSAYLLHRMPACRLLCLCPLRAATRADVVQHGQTPPAAVHAPLFAAPGN